MKTNEQQLPEIALPARPRPPVGSTWQVSHDGEPFCTFRTGGISYNVKVGDPALGWPADHLEPGVSCWIGEGGDKDPNLALQVFSCIGNPVRVTSGEARGAEGVVTGKHGGVENILVDFPQDVLDKLTYDDKLLVRAHGVGLRLLDHPGISCFNLSPALLHKMGTSEEAGRLRVPVAGIVPGGMMGSGIGSTQPFRGDYDIQTADPEALAANGLDRLRLGDIVAITDHHATHGWALKKGGLIIGVVSHADSFKSGHGPGVTNLLTCTDGSIEPVLDGRANLAELLGIGRSRAV